MAHRLLHVQYPNCMDAIIIIKNPMIMKVSSVNCATYARSLGCGQSSWAYTGACSAVWPLWQRCVVFMQIPSLKVEWPNVRKCVMQIIQ